MKALLAVMISMAIIGVSVGMPDRAGAQGEPGARPATGLPMSLTGSVVDEGGVPLSGVQIRVFAGGLVLAGTSTDVDGTYVLDYVIGPRDDSTVAVWCIAPRTDLVSELALIRESRRDRRLELWSPCVPRIGMQLQQTWSVRLVDRTTFRRELAGSDCLN